MKRTLKSLFLASVLSLTMNSAQAGGGLSIGAISNLAQGNIVAAAIGGGLGAASLVHGLNLVDSGKVGWGVFFLILEEEEVISAADRAVLEDADVATKEAFLDIIGSDLSEAEKSEELALLFE